MRARTREVPGDTANLAAIVGLIVLLIVGLVLLSLVVWLVWTLPVSIVAGIVGGLFGLSAGTANTVGTWVVIGGYGYLLYWLYQSDVTWEDLEAEEEYDEGRGEDVDLDPESVGESVLGFFGEIYEEAYGTTGGGDSERYPEDWDQRRKKVLRRDGYECVNCGKGSIRAEYLDVDHIVPISRGGSHDLTNLQTLCRSCHESKHGHRIPSPDDGPSWKWW